MKRINERRLIRQFIDILSENTYDCCKSNACECNTSHEEDYSLDYQQNNIDNEGYSRHDLDPDNDGIISQDDLYNHFDLNNNGYVTTDEYKDHIDFHCKHPESLNHYNTLRSSSIKTVPCIDSYDSCSRHLLGNPEGIENYLDNISGSSPEAIEMHLKPLMDETGATCKNSSVSAILDVFQSLMNCGLFK